MHWTQIIIDSEVYNYEYFLQEDVCRLCWNKDANIDLDNKKTQNTAIASLLDIIKECLEIDLHNINPTKLCENCCNELKRFYSYKTFCRESVQKLQEIIQKGISELNNKVLELSAVKEEVIDENIDNLDTYFDDTIDFEQKRTKPLSNSKFEKKYLIKRSPTYCHKCSIDLESEEQLFIHNNEVHGIEKNGTQFKCFGCEKRFKSRKTCVSHEVNFCKGLKDGYKCNICERYLPKRCIYESHMRDHRHNARVELPELMFKCGKCLKLFKSKELLKNHLVEHESAKNYVCDACGRIFTRLDYLSKHKLTHTGTKKHHCPHCDFKATQRSSLTVHLRKHTGERPYSCDLCPQRCISSSNLRAHRRRHLGDKKFECTICNKKFGYKLSLEEHISCTHVRSESHPCEYCGATYSRLRGLRRHLAAKHSKHKSKAVEQSILVQVTENADKIHILKDVEYELKDSDNVLLLKHQDGDVYMV